MDDYDNDVGMELLTKFFRVIIINFFIVGLQ